jgi:hypothetical protein
MIYEISATRVVGDSSIPCWAYVEATSGAGAIDRLGALGGGHNFSIISVAVSQCQQTVEHIILMG